GAGLADLRRAARRGDRLPSGPASRSAGSHGGARPLGGRPADRGAGGRSGDFQDPHPLRRRDRARDRDAGPRTPTRRRAMSVQHDDVARASAGRALASRAGRKEAGVALIEAAFVLPILLVLAMGMLDFGRAFHPKTLLDQAAREGVRLAVITSPDPGLVTSRVNAILAPAG